MCTIDLVIAQSKMRAGPEKYESWKSTIQSVSERGFMGEHLRRRKTRAIGFLKLSLIDMIELFILITTDPAIAWKILANVYSTQTIADVMKTLNKWENLRMMDGMMYCLEGKQTHESITKNGANRSKKILELIHANLLLHGKIILLAFYVDDLLMIGNFKKILVKFKKIIT
uniref:Uncharacterized protein n=1 Tax=Physcomitrium patens TaxID=3218 RepID=A0A2K1JYH0_PHYPA|nr:hypothetical protein PHYPA_013692 [Physcomitrium patens]